MSALEALALARARDVAVELKGGQLRLLSHGHPPSDVLAALKDAKPQVIILLTPDASGTSGVDYWRVFNDRFAERVAAEVEPELARLEAFDAAFNEWLKCSFDLIGESTDPSRCAHCGKSEASDPLLPFGPNALGRHAWVHNHCHQPWRKARQEKALAALSANGIEPPAAWLIAKAESEAYDRFLVDFWRARPVTYARDVDVAWAKQGLEAIRDLGFRACHKEEDALRIVDATGEERPPPAHVVKGLGRIMRGLRVNPELVEAIWPSDGDSSKTPRLSPPGGEP
jgi:hypothetical protein